MAIKNIIPTHFHSFQSNVSSFTIPEKFTFPFYYEPTILAKIAAKEVQQYLEKQTDFVHNFGLNDSEKPNAIGKMFGVLVVQNYKKEVGFLAAFSGKLADKSLPIFFVPPVFNMRTEGSFYIKGELELNNISKKITLLENSSEFLTARKLAEELLFLSEKDLKAQRKKMKLAKKERKTRKQHFEKILEKTALEIALKKLAQESFNDQFYYRELNEYWQEKVATKVDVFESYLKDLTFLRAQRKQQSAVLQQTLFSKYQFLNSKNELKGLDELFSSPDHKPPAGSGECAAPKLLQYAFQHALKPVAMAEFWWGVSPNSEIRKHKNFYPACQGRCKPILAHMLSGVCMDENPLLQQNGDAQTLEIIYEDAALIVVNKPAELLSVPGKELIDSVYTRVKLKFPNATGPLIVHRLDMATSGLMVLAKTKDAHKNLQKQFINRTVKKKYIALLDGVIHKNKGKIDLPLRVDLDDRPRQLVCYEHGKLATTLWEVLERTSHHTKVAMFPITGRTHQLRVHAAHLLGLNTPIVGDDLYGTKSTRLHLHAAFLEISHPNQKKVMRFEVESSF